MNPLHITVEVCKLPGQFSPAFIVDVSEWGVQIAYKTEKSVLKWFAYQHVGKPPTCISRRSYENGAVVEALVKNMNNISTWQKGQVKVLDATAKIFLADSSSFNLDDVNHRVTLSRTFINKDEFRKCEIPVPQHIQGFMQIPHLHDAFLMNLDASACFYEKSSKILRFLAKDQSIIDMVQKCIYHHFRYIQQFGWLQNGVENVKTILGAKGDFCSRTLQITPNFMGYVIGIDGNNIRHARAIPGIYIVDVDAMKSEITIKGTRDAIDKAATILN